MATLPSAADEIPGLLAWLATHGTEPAGPPFIKYNVIDMARELQVEAGVPVAAPVAGDNQVPGSLLPGGQYTAVTHVGPYETSSCRPCAACWTGPKVGPDLGQAGHAGR